MNIVLISTKPYLRIRILACNYVYLFLFDVSLFIFTFIQVFLIKISIELRRNDFLLSVYTFFYFQFIIFITSKNDDMYMEVNYTQLIESRNLRCVNTQTTGYYCINIITRPIYVDAIFQRLMYFVLFSKYKYYYLHLFVFFSFK